MIRLFTFSLCFLMSVQCFAQERPGAPPARDPIRVERVDDMPAEQTRSPLLDRMEQQREAFQESAENIREILILADRIERSEIAHVLEAQELEILETYTLTALESLLIVTRGDDAVLQNLRLELPQVEIDWNDDLSASKGPRLYAKDKIKWPDDKACLSSALKIPIGLLDGSIERSHPAFAGQTILEQNFLKNAAADKQHATAIASILIGNAPDQGFDGLLTGAKLYNAVVLRHTLNDRQRASIEAALRGLDWLMSKNIRLINVSLSGQKNRVLISAFEKSLERGVLIFAAAGNNGPGAPPVYPAAIEGVLAVTAIDAAGKPYKHANTGRYIDFLAPGVDVWTATTDGNGAYTSGTSYATPYVLAVSALHLTKNRNLSANLLINLLDKNIAAVCP